MNQTLQHRNLENCSLNDHKTQILPSSITVHFLYSLPSPRIPTLQAPNPLASESSPVGNWEEVSSKLGSKPAQLIHRGLHEPPP